MRKETLVTVGTATVGELKVGDRFTDHMGFTYVVGSLEIGVANGYGTYVYVNGQSYPEFYATGQEVTLIAPAVATAPAAAPIRRRRGSRRDNVASVYAYLPNGKMRKFGYTTWDNMHAGIDRLIAKGYVIHTYA